MFGGRSLALLDLQGFLQNTAKQLLFQFDDKIWLTAFYIFFMLLIWGGWLIIRRRSVSAEKRLLCFMACFFPVPMFAAAIIFSGGVFTTYYTYLLPLLFMAGAIVFSILIDMAAPKPGASAVGWTTLSLLILAALLGGGNAKHILFSPARAIAELTSDEDLAYCYWRFGRSFGNYVPFDGNTERYATDMLAACGRLGSREKTNECLWGWSAETTRGGFSLDERAVNVLGREAAGLVARSVGVWEESVAECFSIHETLVDECILGVIEKASLQLYLTNSMIRPPSLIKIPCLPEQTRFSGLLELTRAEIRKKAASGEAQDCPEDILPLCVMADAYCAAADGRAGFCDASYVSSDDANLCKLVYIKTREALRARDAAMSLDAQPGG